MAVIEAGRTVSFEESFGETNDITGVALALKPLNISELKEDFYGTHQVQNDEYASPRDFFEWLVVEGYIEDIKPVREFLGTDLILDMPR